MSDQEVKGLGSGLISVSFDYPFQLRCPPTFYPVVLDSGLKGFIKIEHKEGLILFDKGSNTDDSPQKKQTVREKKIDGQIRFKTEGGSWIYVDMDENGSVLYPKYFTKIEVIFSLDDAYKNPSIPDNAENLNKLSRDLFKRFLFSYMYGVGDFSLEISEKSLWPTQKRLKLYLYTDEDKVFLAAQPNDLDFFNRVKSVYDKFVVYPGFEKMAGFISADIALSDYSSLKKENCTKDDFYKMFKALCEPQAIEPHLPFIFSAIRRSHMDDEHFLAIVDLATAVEIAFVYFYQMYSFMFDQVDRPLLSDEYREKDLKKRFEKFSKDISLQSKEPGKSTRVRILDTLKSRFEDVVGNKHISVADSANFLKWVETVWNVRHSIVHSGNQLVTKDEFSHALKITQAVINALGFDQITFKKVYKKLNDSV